MINRELEIVWENRARNNLYFGETQLMKIL